MPFGGASSSEGIGGNCSCGEGMTVCGCDDLLPEWEGEWPIDAMFSGESKPAEGSTESGSIRTTDEDLWRSNELVGMHDSIWGGANVIAINGAVADGVLFGDSARLPATGRDLGLNVGASLCSECSWSVPGTHGDAFVDDNVVQSGTEDAGSWIDGGEMDVSCGSEVSCGSDDSPYNEHPSVVYSTCGDTKGEPASSCTVTVYCGEIGVLLGFFNVVHCWVEVDQCDGTHLRYDKWQDDFDIDEVNKENKERRAAGRTDMMRPLTPPGGNPEKSNIILNRHAPGWWPWPSSPVAQFTYECDWLCLTGWHSPECSRLLPESVVTKYWDLYNVFGPNSNTFAQSVLRNAGIDYTLPVMAIGRGTADTPLPVME